MLIKIVILLLLKVCMKVLFITEKTGIQLIKPLSWLTIIIILAYQA